jgi:hypothetical protein
LVEGKLGCSRPRLPEAGSAQPTDPNSEILQDVKEGDRLVTNTAVDLSEGAVVTAKPLSKPPAPTLANPTTKA